MPVMFQLRPQGSIPLCHTRIHRVLGRHTLVIALYIVSEVACLKPEICSRITTTTDPIKICGKRLLLLFLLRSVIEAFYDFSHLIM